MLLTAPPGHYYIYIVIFSFLKLYVCLELYVLFISGVWLLLNVVFYIFIDMCIRSRDWAEGEDILTIRLNALTSKDLNSINCQSLF